ncbi:MAG: hypothetical protein K8T90_05450 [Planctomycetes bacterium]|nr:hypothetical protein [Planctomycetota bacterium]
MPTEADWVETIRQAVRAAGGRTGESEVALADRALAEHPTSARLWNVRGDVIQLLDDDPTALGLAPDEALRCYERAVAEAPDDFEAYESIGFYRAEFDDDAEAAEEPLRRALALGAGAAACAGLAQVLAELGRADEAKALIDPATCPHAGSTEVEEVRAEIESGAWEPDDTPE